MTPERAKLLIPVLTAFKEGKIIQWNHNVDEVWHDYREYDFKCDLPFMSEGFSWRVKPLPREWWVCPKCKIAYQDNENGCAKSNDNCGALLVHVYEVDK